MGHYRLQVKVVHTTVRNNSNYNTQQLLRTSCFIFNKLLEGIWCYNFESLKLSVVLRHLRTVEQVMEKIKTKIVYLT